MKFAILSLLALFLVGSHVPACYDCSAVVQSYYVAPQAVVTYRTVQPVIVRESVQLERTTYEREPVVVERQEKVMQYTAAPQIQLIQTPYYASALRVQKVVVPHAAVRVQVHGAAVRQNVIVQKQVVSTPSTVIQQNTVRRGLFGRIRQSSSTTIVNP